MFLPGDRASVVANRVPVTAFSSQNGEERLRRVFGSVERTDLRSRAVFGDREAALTYLRSSDEPIDWQPPTDGWPREYAGEVTVFCCR